MSRRRIAALGDVPEGSNRAFDVGGRSILICRSSADLFASDNQCSHAFSHLEAGRVTGAFLFCPLHSVRFNLRNGKPSGNLTRRSLAVYPVHVEGGEIVADLPDD
jgi:3-phenylpropionate/trans-cinnamate dioxygenase ferredoxin subunit